MKLLEKNKLLLRRVYYFFPLQLLLAQVKGNYILLVFWLLLFGYTTGAIGETFGIPYLFLDPEYLGKVNFWSYLIMGLAVGGFVMAYNISSYIVHSNRFPFIATLSRPFFKYCINNALLPLLYVLTFIYQMVTFQMEDEFIGNVDIVIDVLGFLGGYVFFILVTFSYFFYTNKDVFKMFGMKTQVERPIRTRKSNKPVRAVLHKNVKWQDDLIKEWTIETYLSNPFKVKLARPSGHYTLAMLEKVFTQNYFNAAFFEIFIFVTLLVLGLFREYSIFVIPAGASIILLFTMFLMLFSALHSWLKGWATTVFIILFLLLNYFSRYESVNYKNYAYGLNYNTEKPTYNNERLHEMSHDEQTINADIEYHLEILNKWRIKNNRNTIERKQKPKLVFVNTSGGGIRSALWTFRTLQYADSLLNGELLKHTHLITGSSGGMMGAAYMRELFLLSQEDSTLNYYHDSLREDISSDLLNPVVFSMAVNDLFIRLQQFNDGQYTYNKDRAYAFESQLHQNTHGILEKRMLDYTLPESEAKIPMMVFSPTIINDGRRLIIASLPFSYLTNNIPLPNVTNEVLAEGVEFSRFFEKQDAQQLRFSSAIRLSSTFPYILPVVSLPSEPTINLMDAGMRDNYGLVTSLKYLYTFRNWISSNTSGVIIIQIRDHAKELEVEKYKQSLLQTLIRPLGSFYANWESIQRYNQDELLQYAGLWFDGTIDVINFQLKNEKGKHISLSWHLTTKEKKQILKAIYRQENQNSMEQLKTLLE